MSIQKAWRFTITDASSSTKVISEGDTVHIFSNDWSTLQGYVVGNNSKTLAFLYANEFRRHHTKAKQDAVDQSILNIEDGLADGSAIGSQAVGLSNLKQEVVDQLGGNGSGVRVELTDGMVAGTGFNSGDRLVYDQPGAISISFPDGIVEGSIYGITHFPGAGAITFTFGGSVVDLNSVARSSITVPSSPNRTELILLEFKATNMVDFRSSRLESNDPIDAVDGLELTTLPSGTLVRIKGSSDITLNYSDGAPLNHEIILKRYPSATGKPTINWGGSVTYPNVANKPNVLVAREDNQSSIAFITNTGVANAIVIDSEEMIYEAAGLTVSTVLGAKLLQRLNSSNQAGWTQGGTPTIGANDISTDGVDDSYYIQLGSPVTDKAMVLVGDIQALTDELRFGFCDDSVSGNTCFGRVLNGKAEIYIRTISNELSPGAGTPFDRGLPAGNFTGGEKVMIYLQMSKAGPQLLEIARLDTTIYTTAQSTRSQAMQADNAGYTGTPRISVGADYRGGGQADIFAPALFDDLVYCDHLTFSERADLWTAYKNELSV